MLFPIDLHKDFINVEGIAVALMSAFQPTGIFGSKLGAPESDRLVTDCDATFGQEIFDEWSGTPAVAEIEAVVEPNGVTDDFGREPVTFIGIHHRTIDYWELSCQYPSDCCRMIQAPRDTVLILTYSAN